MPEPIALRLLRSMKTVTIAEFRTDMAILGPFAEKALRPRKLGRVALVPR